MTLTVCRRGPCKYPITVEYKNVNINFIKNRFVPAMGEITLEAGERSKDFKAQVQLLDDDNCFMNVFFLHLTR